MDKAQLITREGCRLVSAQEFKDLFRGVAPSRAHLLCPLCQQRVIPSAMSRSSKTKPHFKHERNNEQAHECDLYAKSLEAAVGYEKAPMPMFLRPSKNRPNAFVMELGFKKLPDNVMEELIADEACVVIGRKRYRVSRERFGAGVNRLPLDKPMLEVGESVRLERARRRLYETWGRPENAIRAMVFSCDPGTHCGRRLRPKDGVENDSLILIVAPPREKTAIENAFPGFKEMGKASVEPGYHELSVFLAYVDRDDQSFRAAQDFLSDCGFNVVDSPEAPRVVWPPCLSSIGEHQPLIDGNLTILLSQKTSSEGDYAYASQPELNGSSERRVPLIPARDRAYSYSLLRTQSDITIISTSKSFTSSTVLTSGNCITRLSLLKESGAFSLTKDSKGLVTAACPSKCTLIREKKGRGIMEIIGINSPETTSISLAGGERLKIAIPLAASKGNYVADSLIASTKEKKESVAHLQDGLRPIGMQRAIARKEGVRFRNSIASATKSHAQAREERERG